MKLGLSPDIVMTCLGCGTVRGLEGGASRVVDSGKALYVDTPAEPCGVCRGIRSRITVSFNDGSPKEHEGDAPPSSGHR